MITTITWLCIVCAFLLQVYVMMFLLTEAQRDYSASVDGKVTSILTFFALVLWITALTLTLRC